MGGLNGLAILLETAGRKPLAAFARGLRLDGMPRLLKGVRILLTFSFINLTWIFFRANSLSDAFYVVTHLFQGVGTFFGKFAMYLAAVNLKLGWVVDKTVREAYLAGQSASEWRLALTAIVLLEVVHFLQARGGLRVRVGALSALARWSIYYGAVVSILIYGVFSRERFIYFQF